MQVPGVPVVYGHKNALFLEQISKSQREHANKMAKAHLRAAGTDSTLLGKRRTRDSEAEGPDTHDILEDQNLAPKSLTKSDSARNTSGLVDKTRFKRNKAKVRIPMSIYESDHHFYCPTKLLYALQIIIMTKISLSCWLLNHRYNMKQLCFPSEYDLTSKKKFYVTFGVE